MEQKVTDIPNDQRLNDQRLTQYLLGTLPAPEAERLDELSVTDDAFAAQLSAAENDLVDAFVSGELSATDAARFKAAYLSSPRGLEKVRFAESFFSFQQSHRIASIAASADTSYVESAKSRWRFFTMPWTRPWLVPQWGLAAAALLLLVASGYLVTSNLQLRRRIDRSEAERTSLAQKDQELQRQLEARPTANPATSGTEPTQPPQDQSIGKLGIDKTGIDKLGIDKLKIAAFMLVPSLRDSGPPPTVSASADTDLVVLKLELESNDFSRYRAAIEDSATRRTLWTSSELKPFADGDKHAVSFAFRSSLLKMQNYLVQLKGIHANGTAELVSSYPFRGVIK